MGLGRSKDDAHRSAYEALQRAELVLLQTGMAWWQRLQASSLVVAPVSVGFKVFDVHLAPTAEANPVLHAEERKHGRSLHIHTALFAAEERLDEEVKPGEVPVVLLHGYGSGIGIFSASLAPLAATVGRKVFAVDGLGCALSARPRWTLGYGERSDLDLVEEYSADALELWRRRIGAEKIILCGHSIGGYLSVAYAERYPERVEKLVLISPAGLAGPPPEDPSRPLPALYRFARFMWAQGFSPMALSKYVFGRYFIDMYVQRRFPDYEWLEKPAVTEYLHGVWTFDEPSAGAYHHNTVLVPGAYARRPLEERIAHLKVKCVAAIYGTSDWMNPKHFVRASQRLHELRNAQQKDDDGGSGGGGGGGGGGGDGDVARPTSRVESGYDGGSDGSAQTLQDLQLMLCARAGHNLQIDNPLAFVAAMQAILLGHVPPRFGHMFDAADFQFGGSARSRV
jgi:pimeloyl-ACP methyl ester carboxylesterase